MVIVHDTYDMSSEVLQWLMKILSPWKTNINIFLGPWPEQHFHYCSHFKSYERVVAIYHVEKGA